VEKETEEEAVYRSAIGEFREELVSEFNKEKIACVKLIAMNENDLDMIGRIQSAALAVSDDTNAAFDLGAGGGVELSEEVGQVISGFIAKVTSKRRRSINHKVAALASKVRRLGVESEALSSGLAVYTANLNKQLTDMQTHRVRCIADELARFTATFERLTEAYKLTEDKQDNVDA
jgi:hypothetical protein